MLTCAECLCRKGECDGECGQKPTNADRIRSMSDEELAKLMVASCPEHTTIETCRLHEKCYECWLEWLKQEAQT